MIRRLIPLREVEGRADELSDEALVAACGCQDRAALAALFDRHHLRVHRFLCRMGVELADAEDLLQETFAGVWSSAHRYRRKSGALTWIFGIAANLARNHSRSRGRRERALRGLSEVPRRPSERADEAAEKKELLERLQAALTELPHDHRAALVMCDLEGASGVEVARAMGVRPGTVWRWLHLARKALKLAVEVEER